MAKAILFFIFYLTTLLVRSQERLGSVNSIMDSGAIYSLLKKADSLDAIGLRDSALITYSQAVPLSKTANYTKGIVYSYFKIAELQEKGPKSITIANLTLRYFQHLSKKDHHLIPAIYNLQGLNFAHLGMYDSAVNYYNLALFAMDSLNIKRPKFRSIIFNNIGTAFINMKQLNIAVAYYHKALAVTGIDSTIQAEYYGNIAVTYANLIQNIDSAMYWWQKALVIFRRLDKKERLQYFYANMSLAWQSSEHRDLIKAAKYLDSAIDVSPNTAESHSLIVQASATLDYHKGDYRKAIIYGNQLLAISRSNNQVLPLSQAYLILSYSYAFLGDKNLAESYAIRHKKLAQEINNESVRQTTLGLEYKYRTAEKERALADKEKALALAKAETYRQRNWLFLSGGGFLVLGLLSVGFVRNVRHRRRLDNQKITTLEQQNRIQALSVRMEAEENERIRISSELHDSLGVLISAAKLNNTLLRKNLPAEVPRIHTICTDAATILNNIHQEMRTIAHNLKPEYYISGKGLGDALRQLVSKLHDDHFEISVSEFGPAFKLHPEKSFIVFRILEEIINNSLRHSQGSQLEIQLVYTDTGLNISAEDNGVGFDSASVKAGIGLDNIRRRIEQLQGHLNLNTEKGKGSAYLIEIPY